MQTDRISISEGILCDNYSLPWCIHLDDKVSFEMVCTWFSVNQKKIESQLSISGAILFRGFNIDNQSKFANLLNVFGDNYLDYVDGNSPRLKLSSKIYTSTEFPSEHTISMHNEMSYSHVWPRKLYFCCDTAPLKDGNTLIADCRKVLENLDDNIVNEFTRRKVKYSRCLHSGYGFGPSWQETFETNDKSKVELYCQKANIVFNWSDEYLRLHQTVSSIIKHPSTGERVWFNQADQFHPSSLPKAVYDGILSITQGDKSKLPTYSTFGDGGEIPIDIFKEIKDTFLKNTVYFPWEKGDLLVVDNVLVAHGRASFKGPRKILVAMS